MIPHGLAVLAGAAVFSHSLPARAEAPPPVRLPVVKTWGELKAAPPVIRESLATIAHGDGNGPPPTIPSRCSKCPSLSGKDQPIPAPSRLFARVNYQWNGKSLIPEK
ncbi:MAG TPA: hypothetical protein VIS74_07475 [Chthoniobacterales bacterium]